MSIDERQILQMARLRTAAPGPAGRRRLLVRLWATASALAALAAAAQLAARADASVWSWGSNRFGELGEESLSGSDVPVKVRGLSAVTQVVASDNFCLALLGNGQVWAWGSDRGGELGDGSDAGSSSVPVQVQGLNEVTAISSTHGYSLALLRDGEVMAWGTNKNGRMGDGSEGQRGSSDTPVPVQGLTGVTGISASQFHALAVRKNGSVMTWGSSPRGALGDGEGLTSSDVPVPVHGISDAVAVAAGNIYSLVLLSDGTVLSFGANEFGQLGDGRRTPSYVPVPVSGLSEVTAISAGAWQNLALLREGTVMAWGWNKSGELGDGTNVGPEMCGHWGCSTVPIPVGGLGDVTAISAASNTFTGGHNVNDLVLLRNGSVMGWGGNEDGQLGDGTTTSSYVPVEVEGLERVTAISAGGRDSLAIDGAVLVEGL
jgi:alpha-tubulin suppressor-like RCC1 family protein